MKKEEIVKYFDELSNPDTTGLEHFLSSKVEDEVIKRLENIDNEPLSKVQLNQLLIMSGLNGIKYGFYKYYWLSEPNTHPYKVRSVEDFDEKYTKETAITSLKQLKWGLRRIYIDGLLYYGNITNGFKHLSHKRESELIAFFKDKNFETEVIKSRGKPLKFQNIPKDDRYLISEMACKTYEMPADKDNLRTFLIENYRAAVKAGVPKPKIRDLFSEKYNKEKYSNNFNLFEYSAEDIMEFQVTEEKEIGEKYSLIADRFDKARRMALQNTKYYLSLVTDLDVYLATSMRKKQHFIEMAETCEKIFKDKKINDLNLRFFDPTISSADGHEDKGLIECLMVKCAKVLIYSAGENESYGKDAEAAMALSSGKPVIFYCMTMNKAEFYKKVHPLTKLIDFSTGVANGAMITFNITEVVELLFRVFNNQMEYQIEQHKKGYFRLLEKSTQSTVRIQTNNELLSNSFWNYFDKYVKS